MTGDHVAKDLRITRWKRVEREQEQLDEASRVVEQLDAAEKSILRGKARSEVKCSKSRDDSKCCSNSNDSLPSVTRSGY